MWAFHENHKARLPADFPDRSLRVAHRMRPRAAGDRHEMKLK
jgi:hypothetical protein